MTLSYYNAIILTIVGIITGTSVGLTGIGSGILTVPLLIYLGMTPQETVATVLLMHVIPQSLPGLYLYYKKGHLDVAKSIFVVMGSVIGVYIGSYIGSENIIGQDTLYKILAAIMALSSLFIYFKHVCKIDYLFYIKNM
tara:strand:+ start:6834 stop:7250 length:417 start_codon:yes stop_codon:yes gene_type:complete